MTELYAVQVTNPDGAVVRPPGSKSITNRALVAAALAPGRSSISAPLISDDTEAMIGCLRRFGVEVELSDGFFEVRSKGYLRSPGTLDARASGTTARFITAVATLADGPSTIDGTERMRRRPIGALARTLTALGATVRTTEGFPPVEVSGGSLLGGRTRIDVSESSQFASAVMLVAPRAEQPVILELGESVVSRPYLDTTMEVMRSFGAHIGWVDDSEIRIESIGYRPARFHVEADASAAVYVWAAAAVTGSTVTVAGLDHQSTQADLGVLDIMRRMGCSVAATLEGVAVTGPPTLVGTDVDMNSCPDAALAVAVLAAFADGPTTIGNVANLRIKETDRLAALEVELAKLGASTETGAHWITIEPGPTRPAQITTYDDHRIAMSFAIAGLRQAGVVIEDPGCVTKTWPGFFEMLESL